MIGLAVQDGRPAKMAGIDPIKWTTADQELWARIRGHDFEPEAAALTFVRRLARDHGWSLGFARGAIEEYRRFCFLTKCAGIYVTPSEEVDEVWHLHLTYSRDYWEIWCREILRLPLHHQPTVGGETEALRFARQYAETLACYEAWFGPPDIRYWPGTSHRFHRGCRYRIVDMDRALVIPIPFWMRQTEVWSKAVVERVRRRLAIKRLRPEP